MDWEIDEKMPKFNDIDIFEVWIYGQVRKVKRVGNNSLFLSPGTLAFIDCTHPEQNVICDERDVRGWRMVSRSPVAPTIFSPERANLYARRQAQSGLPAIGCAAFTGSGPQCAPPNWRTAR